MVIDNLLEWCGDRRRRSENNAEQKLEWEVWHAEYDSMNAVNFKCRVIEMKIIVTRWHLYCPLYGCRLLNETDNRMNKKKYFFTGLVKIFVTTENSLEIILAQVAALHIGGNWVLIDFLWEQCVASGAGHRLGGGNMKVYTADRKMQIWQFKRLSLKASGKKSM